MPKRKSPKAPNPAPAPAMLESPRRVAPSITGRRLQVRHPWLAKVILNFGVAKLNHMQRGALLDEVSRLVRAAPLAKEDSPPRIRDAVLDSYFRNMPQRKAGDKRVTTKVLAPDGQKHEIQDEVLMEATAAASIEMLGKSSLQLDEKDRTIHTLRERIAHLEARLEAMGQSLGEKTEYEKALTIQAAWEHWVGKDGHGGQLRSAEREQLIGRTRAVLSELSVLGRRGFDCLHAEVTLGAIEQAVAESRRYGKNSTNKKAVLPISPKERQKRGNSVRRFFRDISLPPHEGGLGLMVNPAANLRMEVRSRRNNPTLDPAVIVGCKGLDKEWKAIAAICGYAGCRLSEAASLTWERINWKGKTLDVLPSEEKPALKNERSSRTIKPFENLWPVLKAYRGKGKPSGLLFVKQSGESWFGDDGQLTSLSTRLGEALKDAGIDSPEPARRLRRWWETTMRAKGHASLIEIMGGHSAAVGLSNYTDRSAVAKAAKVGKA